MNAEVIKLPTAKRSRKAPVAVKRGPSAAMLRRIARQRAAGYINGGFAFALTALSLSHLAEFVQHATHRAVWEAWSTASVVDGGFISAEILPFLATAACVRETRRSRLAFRIAVLCASAAANAIAFSSACDPAYRFVAMAIGVAVPAAIAYFSHMAGRCLLGKH